MSFERIKAFAGTLRFRLMVWNAIVVVLTAVTTLLGVREGVRVTILNEMDAILIEDLLEIEYKLIDGRTTPADIRKHQHAPTSPVTLRLLADLNRKARGHRQHGWFVELEDSKGDLLWSSQNSPPGLPRNQPVGSPLPTTVPGYRLVLKRTQPGPKSELVVRVGASTDFLARDMSRIDRQVALAASVILLSAPPIGYWLAGRSTRPISEIIQATAQMRPHALNERLPVRHTGDELDQLAATINGFLNRLAEYVGQRRDFLANSAHELRSPLSAIRSSVEVALHSPRTREQYQELLLDVIEECSDLEILVNQLLLLAETEGDRLRTTAQPANLSIIVQRSIDMFMAVAESQEIHLLAQVEPDVMVVGQAHHLRQLVNNLIDNAIKFTPALGAVTVSLRRTGKGQCEFSVSDTGVGIPPEDQPRVFERFFRGDRSHTREGPVRGTGLGLSICQAVVNAHGGEITLASAPGQGSTFTVVLPQSQ